MSITLENYSAVPTYSKPKPGQVDEHSSHFDNGKSTISTMDTTRHRHLPRDFKVYSCPDIFVE